MRFTEEEHREWFNGQPRKPISGAVLFTNIAGEVLLLKPNYRDRWNLPGGVVNEHESPLDGAIREVKEELNLTLDRRSLSLSSVDYRPATDELVDKLYFYFHGGILNTSSILQIHLQEEEIDEMRFVSLEQARPLLSKWTHRQVFQALSAGSHSQYLENGTPTQGADA